MDFRWNDVDLAVDSLPCISLYFFEVTMFETITYRLDQFEGPLDLLLTLIKKNKVNITDIPIALICDQYVEYIENAKKI